MRVRDACKLPLEVDLVATATSLRRPSSRTRNLRRWKQIRRELDAREGRSKRISTVSRRDRIAPDPPDPINMTELDRPRRPKIKRTLAVDTVTPETPRTAASTPGSVSVRSSGDIRSPGQRKSPVAKIASEDAPVPDFITQTDRFGQASTPRSASAVQQARQAHPIGAKPNLHVTPDGKLSEEKQPEDIEDVDACAETLYDSFRIMCCCLVADDEPVQAAPTTPQPEKDERPRLLPQIHPDDHGKKCLVLDLDETLVHSSFRAVPGADFVIPVQVKRRSVLSSILPELLCLTTFCTPYLLRVQIEDVVHFVYVTKRPGVDEFLLEMAKHYEIVVYTASLNKYADPLLDLLDPHRTIRTRLFRESCVYYDGNYVKDLSLLDRDLSQSIIVDNSPSSYIFHPENAIDCSSFIDDPTDRELDQIAAFLTSAKDLNDVRGVCQQWREWPSDSEEKGR